MSPAALVLLEHADDGRLRPGVAELVGAGRLFGDVDGVWVGSARPADDALAVLGDLGLGVVHVVATPGAHPRLTPVVAEAVASLVTPATRAVLLTSTFENKEVAGRLGVLTGAGAMVDVAELTVEDGRPVATKQVFAATWTTRCAVRTTLAVLALKPHAVAADPVGGPPATVADHEVTVSPVASTVTLVERTERAAGDRPDLGAAQVVVVGGRGTEGDFTPLVDLAEVLGGAVGATRVATDEGWIDRDAQIGQTGVTVSPRLYIGAGVSGAVHHRGGMQASGTVVAINTDADAPIFEIADVGIVGDLRTVLPQATAELRRLLAES